MIMMAIEAEDYGQAYLGRYEMVQRIVMCKDCKHNDGKFCTWHKSPMIVPTAFCSWGEEKKDEE